MRPRSVRSDPFADPAEMVRRVYAYVAYRIGSGPDAEDVTSATIERALRYRHSYDRSQGEPAAWLIGIARRCIADAKGGALIQAELSETAAPGEFETDVAERIDLASAVASLPPRDRELIALRYGADLTSRQIESILGIKASAVDVAIHRALARLRSTLESEGAASGEGRGGVEGLRGAPATGAELWGRDEAG